jgi:hypothetical protein
MSRYRLYPTPTQEDVLLRHRGHARYVWNLAVEQRAWWGGLALAEPTNREPQLVASWVT